MNHHVRPEIEKWNRHIQKVCGHFEADFKGTGQLFIGDVESYLLGKTEVAFIRSNADKIIRYADQPDRVSQRFCFLILQWSGRMMIKYQDQTLQLNEGDIVLLDPEQDISMYPIGLFSHLSIHLSRDKLFEQGIHQEYFGKLNTQNMSGFMLRNLLSNMSVENIRLWYANQDGEAFEDAIIPLIKPTIHYPESAHQNQLKLKIERFIIEHLSHPNLAPKMVAEQIGISLRHLYRLFEDQQSVHAYIQQKRLEKIAFELKDYKNKHLSITEIAGRWGFPDSSHFCKIFKKYYQVTPKKYRDDSLKQASIK
ncbi:AraC family transcriptional regulator (plasmid) [Acinetobacter sp. NCu2D-2]|uniref:transcriptional regulator FeaR n=1 Tax=Acinetobacter sp. NCu2D-2 TaxID=1608473 RepID=UPI0007CDFDEC|nr:transcriptional regulator FeaR [Acinetobacter sp. NCu2D-2]ANF83395.1 AraC family transcriptional regulator [Acinetobacter sp. NCu2D-2]